MKNASALLQKKGTFVIESELNEDSDIRRSDFYAQNGWFQSQTYS
jgi:hypothetical protein